MNGTVFFHYGLLSVLSLIGIHGIFFRDHLVKKAVAFNLLQAGIILLILSVGQGPGAVLNPLSHGLALSVLAVTLALDLPLLALAFALKRRYGSFETAEIARRMRR